jgi:hypothetical protein
MAMPSFPFTIKRVDIPLIVRQFAERIETELDDPVRYASYAQSDQPDSAPILLPLEAHPRSFCVEVCHQGKLIRIRISPVLANELRKHYDDSQEQLLRWWQESTIVLPARPSEPLVFTPVEVHLNPAWNTVWLATRDLETGTGIAQLRKTLVNRFGHYAGEMVITFKNRGMLQQRDQRLHVNPHVSVIVSAHARSPATAKNDQRMSLMPANNRTKVL